MNDILPRVIQVYPYSDYRLHLTFTDGARKEYDCSPLLDFGIFSELKDEYYFNSAFVEDGTVRWKNEQDISPDTLYLDSLPL